MFLEAFHQGLHFMQQLRAILNASILYLIFLAILLGRLKRDWGHCAILHESMEYGPPRV